MKLLTCLFSILFLTCFTNAQSWNQIGPEGGYFKEFTVHPVNTDLIYAGSDDGGGIWKTENGGTTWSLLTASFPNMTGWKIVLDDTNPDIVYACDLYGRYGLLKSNDAGNSWTIMNSGLITVHDKMVSGLVTKSSDTLFISTGESITSDPPRPGNGIFKSYDGGTTWTPAGLQGITTPCIEKNAFGTIFAGTENNGLHYTNDNGITWTSHPAIPIGATIHELHSSGNVLIVAAAEGVFLSSDWGINFSNIGLIGEFNFDACIHKTTPDIEIFCSTLTGLKKYSSASMNWTPVTGSYFTDQIIIGITSDGTNVFCSGFSNSPIVKSTNEGNNWSQLASSPVATELNDLYIDPADNNHMLTCLLGSYDLDGNYDRESVYETTDGGISWIRKGPDAHALCITPNPQNNQEFYLGTFAHGVIKTTDGFNTYTQLSPNGVGTADVIVSPENPSTVLFSEVVWGSSSSIKRSTDAGASFATVANFGANRLLFNPNNADTIYAAQGNGVYLSSDNGLTFNPWQLNGEDCISLASNESDLIVGTSDGKLFKISEGIVSDISGNWQSPVEIKSIFIQDGELFVGLNGAEKDTNMVLHGSIWRSSNNGVSWTDITNDMTSTNIYGNNIIASDGNELFVGTYGGGIFKSTGLNLNANLYQQDISPFLVAPNPALNLLTVHADNIDAQSIQIFDSGGKNVSDRIKKTESTQGEFTIDVSSLNPGTYVLQIESINGIARSLQFVKL